MGQSFGKYQCSGKDFYSKQNYFEYTFISHKTLTVDDKDLLWFKKIKNKKHTREKQCL